MLASMPSPWVILYCDVGHCSTRSSILSNSPLCSTVSILWRHPSANELVFSLCIAHQNISVCTRHLISAPMITKSSPRTSLTSCSTCKKMHGELVPPVNTPATPARADTRTANIIRVSCSVHRLFQFSATCVTPWLHVLLRDSHLQCTPGCRVGKTLLTRQRVPITSCSWQDNLLSEQFNASSGGVPTNSDESLSS